jgi:hypothetical protein
MNTLKMKITGWDEDSKTLLVRFASDETANTNPSAYYDLAFQPHLMFPEANTAVEVRTALAKSGISVAQEIKTNEDLSNNTEKTNMYASLVSDDILSFNYDDLIEDTDGEVDFTITEDDAEEVPL